MMIRKLLIAWAFLTLTAGGLLIVAWIMSNPMLFFAAACFANFWICNDWLIKRKRKKP